MQSVAYSLKQIKNANKIAIICHINADADAIGSSIALKALIQKRYKSNKNLKIDVLTDTNEFNASLLPLISHTLVNNPRYKRYDLAIMLDSPSLNRIGKYSEIFLKAKDTLLIDHHETAELLAKNNVIVHTSSVCEILYNTYIKKHSFKYTNEILRLLYAGIITDTNDLTQNMHNSTHKAIADLLEKDGELGLSLETIHDYFFKNTSKQKMALLARALKSLSFYVNDKIAIMTLFKQDLNDTGCKMDDTMGIVDFALQMKGVDIGAIFIKQEDNSYYVSLRSKGLIDVSVVAKHFNGGGHVHVAAFQTTLPLQDIKQQLIAKCKEQLDNNQTIGSLDQLFAEDI